MIDDLPPKLTPNRDEVSHLIHWVQDSALPKEA
jgi:hypothetical protein